MTKPLYSSSYTAGFVAGHGGAPRPGEPPASGHLALQPPPQTPAQPVVDLSDPLIRDGAMAWGHAPPLHQAPAQTQLFTQRARAEEAYLILQGRIQLRRDNAVRRQVLETFERGDWLALGELLHGRPYGTTAVALEPVTVIAVSRDMFRQLTSRASPLVTRALECVTLQALQQLDALEAQGLDQTFLGLCRGLEMILGTASMPESQLVVRLKELFGLPSGSISEALRLLNGLNLLKCRQETGKEAIISLIDPGNFAERVRSFAEQWRGRLPALLGGDPPREAFKLEEVSELLQVPPAQLLRRMAMPDFPGGLLRFDPEAVESFRKTYGDAFFKKKVSGRELLAQIEAIEELSEIDVALLRDILPRMEVPRLIRLLAGLESGLRAHLLPALSSRVRKTVEQELQYMSPVGGLEQADLEEELLKLCRGA